MHRDTETGTEATRPTARTRDAGPTRILVNMKPAPKAPASAAQLPAVQRALSSLDEAA